MLNKKQQQQNNQDKTKQKKQSRTGFLRDFQFGKYRNLSVYQLQMAPDFYTRVL